MGGWWRLLCDEASFAMKVAEGSLPGVKPMSGVKASGRLPDILPVSS